MVRRWKRNRGISTGGGLRVILRGGLRGVRELGVGKSVELETGSSVVGYHNLVIVQELMLRTG